MSLAQIVAVTTTDIGPAGPIIKIYAVGAPGPVEAMEAVTKFLKAGETAKWIDERSLSVTLGEVRSI